MYKTGHKACYLPDGNIAFLGRIDTSADSTAGMRSANYGKAAAYPVSIVFEVAQILDSVSVRRLMNYLLLRHGVLHLPYRQIINVINNILPILIRA
jgi:hypothetical protein